MRVPEELERKIFCTWAAGKEIEPLIESIQTEAWNEAIEAVAENADYYTGESVCFRDEQSILKLKK